MTNNGALRISSIGNSTVGYNRAPIICLRNYPFLTPNPTTCLIPGPVRPTMPNGSDPPFFHNALDRQTHTQTDRQTDRWLTGMVCNYSPLMLYSSNAG